MMVKFTLNLAILLYLLNTSVQGESAWTTRPGMSMPGLEQVASDTVYNCLRLCIAVRNCTYAEYNTKTYPRCWIQTDEDLSTDEQNLVPVSWVTSYELDREGFITGTKCWTARPGYHYLGLTKVWFKSLEVCLVYCDFIQVCETVDFDEVTSPHCWVQISMLNNTVYEDNLVPRETTTSYMLDRTCMLP